MPNDKIFSDEYQMPPSTGTEKPTDEQEPIEFQLEKEMNKDVQRYGTGKPTREVIRAKIVND